GLSAAETSDDKARSRILLVEALTTGRATAASTRARLILRMAASASESTSPPWLRTYVNGAESRASMDVVTYMHDSRWFGRLSNLAPHPCPAEAATTGNAP